MAEDAEMRREVSLVARELTSFAMEKGWNDLDYWIYYRPNPDWDRVHFVFVSSHFDDQDPYEATRSVWSYLEKKLSAHPEVLKSLNLVVRSKCQVDQGGLYAIGSEYREFYTFYPTPTS
jgi:hypothetical protein